MTAAPAPEHLPVHLHEWRLVGVDWDAGGSVQQWDCECGAVEYR